MEAQHWDVDLFASFYQDYHLFIIHYSSFFVFIPILYSEKVNPKPAWA